MNIPESYMVIDLRPPVDLKGVSICGYKRVDVSTIYQNSMMNQKLEDALKWMVELHASGMNAQIWDSIFQVYLKSVNIQNPHLYLHLLKRQKDYERFVSKYPTKKHEVFTKNDQEIRHLFAECTALITLSKKNMIFTPKSLPKIDKSFYLKESIHKHMIAKSIDQIYHFIHVQMDSDIKLALNEILWNITSKTMGTFSNCVYWHLWIEKVEQMKKKDQPQAVVFDSKDVKPVDGVEEEYWSLWIWPLWDLLLHVAKDKSEKKKFFIQKMYEDYKDDFKPCVINKKKLLFFFTYYLLKNSIEWNLPVIHQEPLLIQSCANINSLYREIKSHIEKDLALDDRNVLYDEYSSLYQQFMEKCNDGYMKPMKHMEPIRNTTIQQIDPTKYPTLKPLSKIQHREEYIPIEYHHMIEEQASLLEREIDRDIEEGHRSRHHRSTSEERRSKVERVRRKGYHEEDEEIDTEKIHQNHKLDLYSQFVSYKSGTQEKKHHDEDHHEIPKVMKTIEFQERRRRKRMIMSSHSSGDESDE